MNVLDIRGPQDIKGLNTKQLQCLSQDIRTFLVENISKTGGHLSSNLGIVELVVALHYVFESPNDKIFFDVGHQSYIHKILTGRAKQFATLRQYNGLSGFQKRSESIHDVWEAGHSSTSLSAALGMCVSRDLNKQSYQVIPVIGDGSLGSGMSFEALNQIGSEQRKMILVLNDNEMSISNNVGAISNACTKLRSSKGYTNLKKDLSKKLTKNKLGEHLLHVMKDVKDGIKHTVVDSTIFGEFGLDYIGPVDGHDIDKLIAVLSSIKDHNRPIVVHVITKKGKGYKPAELDVQGDWHGVSKFDVQSGKPLATLPANHKDYSSILSETLIRLAKDNEDIVAITPAMSKGSKLDRFAKLYPQRFFDCGIAEEHAMTFAAALALEKRPFISVYSSFLQRAYDQINHDVARMNLPVVIGVDRCHLVGEDGDTHHGVFDVSMLYSVPNLIISQPMDANEAQDLMYTAFQQQQAMVIRIPRGSAEYKEKVFSRIEIGSWTTYPTSANAAKAIVITYGVEVERVYQKAVVNHMDLLVVNARFIKPMDFACLDRLANMKVPIFIYEMDMLHGGLSSAIVDYYNDQRQCVNITRIGIHDHFVGHGSIPQLKKQERIDIHYAFERILEEIAHCE